ncbi:MAG: 5-dehydro-2-deoxygluconokinase [Chloroflexi bacterium]|nr:5-dehydro-2-deoxygluconokinase [Chloroflexota bacterium]
MTDRGTAVARTPPDAVVLGRVLADLYPLQSRTPLEDVRTFERFVGGYGGNVGTGLARMGVRTVVVSGVGDDGHGRFITRALAAEGVDTSGIVVHPSLRTALAFCELWPPDHFPLLPYRFPTCPDQEITPDDLPRAALEHAPLAYVSGVAFAQRPSREAAFAALELRAGGRGLATILDLDWRPGYWLEPDAYPGLMARAASLADTVIGSDGEFLAAGLDADRLITAGVGRVLLKHGPDGASLLTPDGRHDEPGLPVPVVNGLGAGDAFAAAFGAGLLRGLAVPDLLRHANAAGAIVATRLACSAAMPTWDEVERMAADPVAWVATLDA